MHRVYAYGFYRLAAKLQPLAKLTAESKYGEAFLDLYTARVEVEGLLSNEIVPIRTCRAVGLRLVAAIDAIVPRDLREMIDKDNEVLLQWSANSVTEELKAFETVLAEELRLVETYSVSQKGAYSTSDLVERAELLFPESVRKQLQPQTLLDVRQAGKCLAFETATASAFHIFRAIETEMGKYYLHITGKAKPTSARNWGVYISTMRKAANADAKIIELLDHIRDKYRNPSTHPEETLTIDDVQVLLGIAVSVIVLMVKATAVPI